MQATPISEEKELLYRLKQGDEPAFEKLYQAYSSRLFGNLYKMVKSEEVAQEILQDVFLKIWRYRATIDPEKSFRSFLFRIAENNVYDFFRKAARDKKLEAQLLAVATEHYEHIEELLLKKENSALLNKAITSLPPQRQQIFRLIKLEEKSYEEVSQMLGISVSTISDHIVKAGKSVREYLFSHLGVEVLLLCLAIQQ